MKVVLVTFGGRKPTLEILFGYVNKYKHYIDEYKIFIATENMDDIEYMENFAKQFEKAKIIYTVDELGISISDKNRIWDNAYKQCQKEDEVYIKLDDDIVYFDETLFTIFLEYRINNPDIPLLFPAIINNIYTSLSIKSVSLSFSVFAFL